MTELDREAGEEAGRQTGDDEMGIGIIGFHCTHG